MLELIINNMCFAMLCCLLIFMVENVVDNLVESKPSIVDSSVELKLSKVKSSIDAKLVKLMFILKLHLLIMVCLISVTMKLT